MEYLKAFLVGGAICLIGQLLIDKTKLTPARILVSYVVIGVLLGAVGLYEPFAEFAGAGATVPLTGFGNTLVKTAPLLMCALSVLFAYKVGLFNIGAAGQYVAGSCACLYAALAWGWGWLPCMLLAIVSGAVFIVPSRNMANTVQSLGRGRCMTTRPTI